MYADAFTQLQRWHDQGHQLYVYSSGSVAAQRQFFAHTEAGDLTQWFAGFFDTEVGGKRESQSYHNILAEIGADASNVLFLSDVVEELDAARAAGIDTVLVDRLDDYPQPREGEACHGHRRVTSFEAITTL